LGAGLGVEEEPPPPPHADKNATKKSNKILRYIKQVLYWKN